MINAGGISKFVNYTFLKLIKKIRKIMFKKSTFIPPKILLFMEKTIECVHFVQLKSFLLYSL